MTDYFIFGNQDPQKLTVWVVSGYYGVKLRWLVIERFQMKHDLKFNLEEDTPEDNKPELVAQTEKLYFALSHNLTKEAKNIIWDFLRLAKVYYPHSTHKKHWNTMLLNLQAVIDDFENELSDRAVLRLYGLQRNAKDLRKSDEIEPETK